MATKATPKTYRQLSEELDEVLANMELEDIGVDDAVKLYDTGLKIITQLEKRLAEAENTITELKTQHGRA